MAFRFGDHDLDPRTYELRVRGVPQPIEPQVFDLLAHLIVNRDRVVTKEELLARVWGDRVVSESALTTRLKEARRAIGDDGSRQELIRTIHGRGYRFVGTVSEAVDADAPTADRGDGATSAALRTRQQQTVDYCVADDGALLAYATIGDGPPLVLALSRLCHLERDWDAPVWRQWIESIAPGRRIVRYDERGGGMSQWDVDDLSVERAVRDFGRVVDASGLERFALVAFSYTSVVPVLYAARHPERVEKLVLIACPAIGPLSTAAGNQQELDVSSDIVAMGWSGGSDMRRRLFAMQLMPTGSTRWWDGFGTAAQPSISRENLAQQMQLMVSVDLREALEMIQVPTLAFHAREDPIVPHRQSRLVASLVPDCRLVTLESANHLLVSDEPAWGVFLGEVERFLADGS
jgi:DNA-binding winged helix-turn-helix (wHTH) protein/pimeloyl-ACP methyl ester carboxylesterase